MNFQVKYKFMHRMAKAKTVTAAGEESNRAVSNTFHFKTDCITSSDGEDLHFLTYQ